MITGIDLNETINFISQFDKGESKTTWKLGVLSTPILSYCTAKGVSEFPLDTMVEVVRFGLKGVENFKSKNGSSIQFSTTSRPISGRNYEIVSDAIINVIPMKVISELGSKILELSTLTDDEAKN